MRLLRSGGCATLFEGVYAASAAGTLLREFTLGHTKQLKSVMREHPLAVTARADLLPGAGVRTFIDIDSLPRPVYGHQKQGASYGHTKIAGKKVLRKGLSALAATIGTDLAAPVIAGVRLRAGKTGSGTASRITATIGTARAAGAGGIVLVRGDCAYGTRKVVRAALRAGAQFSLVLTKNSAVNAAVAAIGEGRWTSVRYPGAVHDPDTGEWISDAEVAEIPYTAFASTKDRTTARLIVHRLKVPAASMPCSRSGDITRSSPAPTNQPSTPTSPIADAVVETVFADLIDAPGSHPSGRFAANSALSCLRPILHLPRHWPWTDAWFTLWHNIISYTPPQPATL